MALFHSAATEVKRGKNNQGTGTLEKDTDSHGARETADLIRHRCGLASGRIFVRARWVVLLMETDVRLSAFTALNHGYGLR